MTWDLDQFPLLTLSEMKHRFSDTDYEFSCHCFAWCHLSARRFLPTGSPTSPPVLEHGDFTLLLCKACFSERVSDKHMVFSEERSLRHKKRWALVCNSENILLHDLHKVEDNLFTDWEQIKQDNTGENLRVTGLIMSKFDQIYIRLPLHTSLHYSSFCDIA